MTTTPPLRTSGIAAARDYKTLPAWQKSMALALRVFTLTERFPAREQTGLAASARAFARSIASEIALASAEVADTGMANRYAAAQGAAAALTTDMLLATELAYITADDVNSLQEDLDAILRLIIAMKHGLKVQAKDEARAERDQAREERAHEMRNRPRDDGDRPRRAYKPRDEGDGERRPYKSRDDGDRPFRKPREDGDRERRPYKPREEGDRERRPYKPREEGDRKPYAKRDGDKPFRKPREDGDRKPYAKRDGDKPFRKPREDGDRKPYAKRDGGDRKGFGKRDSGPRKPFGKKRD